MQRPQTIQIFLPDGSPRSIKIAEITNRVVKAVLISLTQASTEVQHGLFFGWREWKNKQGKTLDEIKRN